MNHLYILTKQEFTSLYRFGYIPIDFNKKIKIKDNSKDQEELILDAFLSLPSFSGDEEYLIISFDLDKLFLERGMTFLKIEHVLEIIPLTKSAKFSLSQKFNSRIHFQDARFEIIIHKVEDRQNINEKIHGAEAFSKLCKSNNRKVSEYENIINKYYSYRKNGKKSSEIKDDFYIHLLTYDRYEFFPKTDLGYYYDVGELYAHSMGLPTFKKSQFHQFLEKSKQELNKYDLLDIFEYIVNSKSELVEKFINQLTCEGIKKYLVAVIFLKFKDDLDVRDTIKKSETYDIVKRINKNHEELKQELDIAIKMTGAFFGYEKFYDDLYDLKQLGIFESNTRHKEPIVNISADENSVNTNDEPNKIDDEKDNQLKTEISNLFEGVSSFEIKYEKLKSLQNIFKKVFQVNKYNKNDLIDYINNHLDSSFLIDKSAGSKFTLKKR